MYFCKIKLRRLLSRKYGRLARRQDTGAVVEVT